MGIFYASALHFKHLFLVTLQWISLCVPGCLLQSNSDISNMLEVSPLLSLACPKLWKQHHPLPTALLGVHPLMGVKPHPRHLRDVAVRVLHGALGQVNKEILVSDQLCSLLETLPRNS